ncbi:hypothetical protein Y032_0084g1692 [Ancylostoma ceylanicum]|uniref:Uncharacterized protein n=1 Tax=Ancylostoma ceylanicum TaxID=53326 RepID=A0A016TQC6_9BILA|nr:hypothetical protein Y032_0084g1692 [Ancylostoma ceylanicum]
MGLADEYRYEGLCPCKCSKKCIPTIFSCNKCSESQDYGVGLIQQTETTASSTKLTTNKEETTTLERIETTSHTVTSTTTTEETVSTAKSSATTQETTTEAVTSGTTLPHNRDSSLSSLTSTASAHEFFSSTPSEFENEDNPANPDGGGSEECSPSKPEPDTGHGPSPSSQPNNGGSLSEGSKMETSPHISSSLSSLRTTRQSVAIGWTSAPTSEDVTTANAPHDPASSINFATGVESTSQATRRKTKENTKKDSHVTTIPTTEIAEKSSNWDTNSSPGKEVSTSVESRVTLGKDESTTARTLEGNAEKTISSAMNAAHSGSSTLHESQPTVGSDNSFELTNPTPLTVSHSTPGEPDLTKGVVASTTSIYVSNDTKGGIIDGSTLRGSSEIATNSKETSPSEFTASNELYSTSEVNPSYSSESSRGTAGSTNSVDDEANSTALEGSSEVLKASLESSAARETSASISHTSGGTRGTGSESALKEDLETLTTPQTTPGDNVQSESDTGYPSEVSLSSAEDLAKISISESEGNFVQTSTNTSERTAVDYGIPSTMIPRTSPVAVALQSSAYSLSATAVPTGLTTEARLVTEGHTPHDPALANETAEGYIDQETTFYDKTTKEHTSYELSGADKMTKVYTADALTRAGKTTEGAAADDLTNTSKSTGEHTTYELNNGYGKTGKRVTQVANLGDRTTEVQAADEVTGARKTTEGHITIGKTTEGHIGTGKITEGHVTYGMNHSYMKTEGSMTGVVTRGDRTTEVHTADEVTGARKTTERHITTGETTEGHITTGKTTKGHVTYGMDHSYVKTDGRMPQVATGGDKTNEVHTYDAVTGAGKTTEGHTTTSGTLEGHVTYGMNHSYMKTEVSMTQVAALGNRTSEAHTPDKVTGASKTTEGHITTGKTTEGHLSYGMSHSYMNSDRRMTQATTGGDETNEVFTDGAVTEAGETTEEHVTHEFNHGHENTEGHITHRPAHGGMATEEHVIHYFSELETAADALSVTTMATTTTNGTRENQDEKFSTFAEPSSGANNGHPNVIKTTNVPTIYSNSTMIPWLTELANPITDITLSTFFTTSSKKSDLWSEIKHPQTYRSSQGTFTYGRGAADGSTTEHTVFATSTSVSVKTVQNTHMHSSTKDKESFTMVPLTTDFGATIPMVSPTSHAFTAATKYSPTEQSVTDGDETVLYSLEETTHEGVTGERKVTILPPLACHY